MSVPLLPSVEVVMVAYFKSRAPLTAITGGRVGTKLGSTLPAIRLARIGAAPPEPWRDHPSVQVECWAGDQGTADTLARTVVAELPGIRNTVVSGGQVYAYTVTSGPWWSPDDPTLSTNARYILTVDLLVTQPPQGAF